MQKMFTGICRFLQTRFVVISSHNTATLPASKFHLFPQQVDDTLINIREYRSYLKAMIPRLAQHNHGLQSLVYHHFKSSVSQFITSIRCFASSGKDDSGNHSGTTQQSTSNARNEVFPGIQRIILIRHGESLGNVDERAYSTTADWRIPLTNHGREQARLAGEKVSSHLSCLGSKLREKGDDNGDGSNHSGKVYFYVSPYLRTRQTLREILREVDKDRVVGIREDPRM